MESSNISQKRTKAAGQNIKERDYWLEKLSGEWSKSVFPYDFSKSGSPGASGPVSFRMDGDDFAGLMR